mmetsp:Transcript_29838/g.77271  ORF Transcript_29838/g.77271 Transcript_29838/m.77271 type:complete len:110 (-) Transcript_29838:838-1167(-)
MPSTLGTLAPIASFSEANDSETGSSRLHVGSPLLLLAYSTCSTQASGATEGPEEEDEDEDEEEDDEEAEEEDVPLRMARLLATSAAGAINSSCCPMLITTRERGRRPST